MDQVEQVLFNEALQHVKLLEARNLAALEMYRMLHEKHAETERRYWRLWAACHKLVDADRDEDATEVVSAIEAIGKLVEGE